jgi:hypothetical protein
VQGHGQGLKVCRTNYMNGCIRLIAFTRANNHYGGKWIRVREGKGGYETRKLLQLLPKQLSLVQSLC